MHKPILLQLICFCGIFLLSHLYVAKNLFMLDVYIILYFNCSSWYNPYESLIRKIKTSILYNVRMNDEDCRMSDYDWNIVFRFLNFLKVFHNDTLICST